MKQGTKELLGEVALAILMGIILLIIILYGLDWTRIGLCGGEICGKY